MKYIYKDAELPCNNKEDFNTFIDIICRLYLEEAPDEKCKKKTIEEDDDNYNANCFFIELVAKKDKSNGEILTNDWLLHYVKNDGTIIEFGYVNDVPKEAWEYFKKEIGIK